MWYYGWQPFRTSRRHGTDLRYFAAPNEAITPALEWAFIPSCRYTKRLERGSFVVLVTETAAVSR